MGSDEGADDVGAAEVLGDDGREVLRPRHVVTVFVYDVVLDRLEPAFKAYLRFDETPFQGERHPTPDGREEAGGGRARGTLGE